MITQQSALIKSSACPHKMIAKKRLEDLVVKVVLELLNDVPLVKRISKTCFALQKQKSTKLSALQKKQKQNKKELDNLLNAIKAGLFTKSTKTELERLENQQEVIEAEIAKEKINNAVVPAEQIEAWILSFAKIKLNTSEHKQKLIDFFVNSIFLYNDKFVIMLNFKGGEKTIRFDDLNEGIKKEHPIDECSSLLRCGDPYGN